MIKGPPIEREHFPKEKNVMEFYRPFLLPICFCQQRDLKTLDCEQRQKTRFIHGNKTSNCEVE